jgi:hypothetical protein
MNLKPRVSSKRWAALIKPRLPSLIRSGSERPWFWYCLATETTKRRLAFVKRSSAFWSPCLINVANRTSSSGVMRSTFPISWRYFSRLWDSRLVIDFVILSWRILIGLVLFDGYFKYCWLLVSLVGYQNTHHGSVSPDFSISEMPFKLSKGHFSKKKISWIC